MRCPHGDGVPSYLTGHIYQENYRVGRGNEWVRVLDDGARVLEEHARLASLHLAHVLGCHCSEIASRWGLGYQQDGFCKKIGLMAVKCSRQMFRFGHVSYVGDGVVFASRCCSMCRTGLCCRCDQCVRC